MKICPNCKNTVEDSAIFCDKCGTRFAVQNNAQSNYAQQPNNQVNYAQQQPYNYGVNQPQYQPVAPKNQPKKKNTGMIIGIIAAVLIVLAIIGSVAQEAFQDQGYGQSDGDAYTPSYDYDSNSIDSTDNNDDSTTNNEGTASMTYNKGSVVDGWYVNEWANMKFDITEQWADGSADEYAAYQGDPNTECGIILNDATNGKQLVICFEKLNGTNTTVTEETYLDIVADGLKQQYTDANLTCEVSDVYDSTVAGKQFKAINITFSESTLVQQFHVYKYDDYMIFVAVTAQNSFDANSTVNNICAVE